MPSIHSVALPAALLAALALGASASSEVVYAESFENMGFVPIGQYGPAGLIASGWTFVNNSDPLGPEGWFTGCCWEPVIGPFEGTGYLAAGPNSSSGNYSVWAILPEIEGQQAGDVLVFYTISSDTSAFDNASLEVRYSPSGGIDPGDTATSVGDFTGLILDIATIPNYNTGLYDGWTKWEVVLPGPGRLALRQDGNESLYFGVDELSIITAPGPEPLLPEGFEDLDGLCGEGPCALVDKGWMFKDQGTLTTGPAWQPPFAGDEFTAHSGFSFIKCLKGGNSGSVNCWAILPEIDNVAGDELTFVVRGGLSPDAVFQVRYSPTGGLNTGSGGSGIGDFTTVLLEFGEGEIPYDAWMQVSADIPGTGRLALRVHDPFQPFFDFAIVVAVDSMDLNGVPTGPPLPAPGETVTWDATLSPIAIETDLFIPPGGTVVVEAGVEIVIAEEATLSIGGTLEGNGTKAQPIVIASATNFPPGISVSGTLDLTFASIDTNVQPAKHGSLLFDQCTFAGPNAGIFNASVLIVDDADAPPYISIDGCIFNEADLISSDATLRLTNSMFVNGANALPLRGYVYVDHLVIDGGSLSISRDQQDVLIDNITVANAPGAAINVGGSNIGNNFFFGPGNLLQGNAYPAGGSGGVLPGSVLPPQGNANDAFLVLPVGFEIFGPITWADAGVPYHVDQSPFLVGGFDVLPGVIMQFPAGHGFPETSGFEARGLPGAPVRFEGLGGSHWCCIFTPDRLEYTEVDGSEFGIVNAAIGLPGFYDSCLFSNNARAQVGGAIVRKSRFLGNDIGASVGFTMDLDGQTNPNSFEGNGLGVQNASDATHNWWGHPSGPSGPQNPGGQGDPVAGGVPVLPFRTTPPELGNHPPIVQLQDIYFVAAPGSTIILNWDTIDDDLVSHRVLVSTQSDVPNQYQVVAQGLPASQRSFALTVPTEHLVFNVYYVRVEGVDSLGQVGWDRKVSSARPVKLDPNIVPPPAPPATEFLVGHPVPIDESITHFQTGFVLLDGQMIVESFGAAGVLPVVVDASSDSVRLGLTDNASWSFSAPFTVRPDERIGDEAPIVTLLAPTGGSLGGGSTVAIAWKATDDEGIRFVSLQGSYDGGLTYHDIARRLPGERTSYDWKLPPLEESISSVRVRVVVEDHRFQNSSATSGALTLTAGSGKEPRPGDLNGDGIVDGADLGMLLGAWGPCPACAADLDGNGFVDGADLGLLLGLWG